MSTEIERALFTDRELDSASVQDALAFARLTMNATEDLLVAAEAQGMTTSKLSRVLGVSRSNVHRQLSGDRNMTLRTLSKLAAALGLDARVVFSQRGVIAKAGETVTAHVARSEPNPLLRQQTTKDINRRTLSGEPFFTSSSSAR